MVLLPLDRAKWAVSGKDSGLIGKGKELAADAGNNVPMDTPGQVGAAHTLEKEGVSGKKYEIAGRVEAHAAGCVSRGVEDGDVGVEDGVALPQIVFRLGQILEKTMKYRAILNTEGFEVFQVRLGGILPYEGGVFFMDVYGYVDIHGSEVLVEFSHLR